MRPAEGPHDIYRGSEYTVDLLPKIKLELVVPDHRAEEVALVIVAQAKSGKIGDGKVFILNVEEAIRIRTEERGEKAI